MKKIVSLLLFLLLVLTINVSALADAYLESSKVYSRYAPEIIVDTNTYIVYNDGSYGLYDRDGNLMSALYRYAAGDKYYGEVYNEAYRLNCRGLISGRTGEQVVPTIYGAFQIVNEDWVMGIKLSQATDSDYDYSVTGYGYCIIDSVDVIYRGEIVAKLSRDEYSRNNYAYGAYCGICIDWKHMLWIDSEGNCISVTSDHVDTEEFTTVYGEGIFHNPTQQYAFDSACMLEASEVKQSIWYNSSGNFIDLQGNAFSQGPYAHREYDRIKYNGGNYMVVYAGETCGIVDMDGVEIIPVQYADIGGWLYTAKLFASGYQIVLDAAGHLNYLDIGGSIVASTPFTLRSSANCKGFNNNAPIIAVKRQAPYTTWYEIFTATRGLLETIYDDVIEVRYPTQRIISVKKNGQWGCIDMSGNVVVPFKHKSALVISSDGTLASGTLNNGDYVIYTISYTDSTAASTATPTPEPTVTPTPVPTTTPIATPMPTPTISALRDGEWQCECGAVNASKFCPECGAAKPVDVIRCDGCGFEPQGAVPNFCPECGRKF